MATENCGVTAVVIPAGGTIVIPAGATIISHTAVDPSTLTTPCPDLEEQIGDAEAYECYEFALEGDVDDSGNNAGSFNIDVVTVEEMQVGTTSYPINKLMQDIGGIYDTLKNTVPFMQFATPHSSVGGNFGPYYTDEYHTRVTINLVFATAPSIATKMRLKLVNDRNTGGGAGAIYYVYARVRSSDASQGDCPA